MSNWTHIARACWGGVEVVSEAPLAGDASHRSYVRLHLQGPDCPPSAIGMVLPEPTAEDAPELPFVNVQRFLAASGTPVPQIFAARDRDLGLLLLEDLGDRSLAATLLDPGTTAGEASRLLRETASLVARWAGLDPRQGRDCVAYGRRHDEALIRRELDMVLSHGLAPSDQGPARSPNSDPEAREALSRLGTQLASQPQRLMHRDFHAWNLHVDPQGKLRVIDFQDAMLGPATYDLASLCTDRNSREFMTPEREATLLEQFAEALAASDPTLYKDPGLLRRDYATSVAFRTLRVIGRFRFLAIEEANGNYLRYIPTMAQETRRALEVLGDQNLARILADRSEYFA